MLRIAERISPKTSEALFKPIHYLKAEENQSKHINECTYPNFVHEFIKSQENPVLLKEDIFLASQNAFRHKVLPTIVLIQEGQVKPKEFFVNFE